MPAFYIVLIKNNLFLNKIVDFLQKLMYYKINKIN